MAELKRNNEKIFFTLNVNGEYNIGKDDTESASIIGTVEDEYYARLFCAAPELLDASIQLSYAVLIIDEKTSHHEVFMAAKKFRAAIAKAIGE